MPFGYLDLLTIWQFNRPSDLHHPLIAANTGNPVITGSFLDSAKASLRARRSAPLRPVEDPDAFGGE